MWEHRISNVVMLKYETVEYLRTASERKFPNKVRSRRTNYFRSNKLVSRFKFIQMNAFKNEYHEVLFLWMYLFQVLICCIPAPHNRFRTKCSRTCINSPTQSEAMKAKTYRSKFMLFCFRRIINLWTKRTWCALRSSWRTIIPQKFPNWLISTIQGSFYSFESKTY